METYTINGVQVEYDIFDITNFELYSSEAERVKAVANGEYSNDGERVRTYMDSVLDFFDTVLGEGASEKIFGDNRRNIRCVIDGFTVFISAVNETIGSWGHTYDDMVKVQDYNQTDKKMNREQRRAADRQKRREEAAKRAALKSGEA